MKPNRRYKIVDIHFLTKLYSELTNEQKIKFNKSLETVAGSISKAV